uniref:RHS repeat domain-containing protein n=2 Tax=Bacteroides bouchesdurhonensis TaxID=1841855 RepID=UPI0009F981C0
GNAVYENGVLRMLLNEAGYVSFPDRKFHFYLKDHQGNTRVVADKDGNVEETNNYYPFGGTFTSTASVQPYKYNGKELDQKNGLNWYDYGARQYDAAIGRWHVVDPMSEKYFGFSSYNYCGNNPINRVDPTGMAWYKNKKTKYYTWFDDEEDEDEEREGYTYIGGKGSVLGEFESIIDKLLTDGFDVGSLYSDGFTFDIVENDKGALLGSKERDWDFLDEFANGVGPEFSIFLSDHPYTMAMMNDKSVLEAHQRIVDGITDIPGQITEWPGNWNLWDAFTTVSIAKQFIGSYRFDAFTSKDGKSLNNVISDSKSMSSFLYHMWSSSWNQRRSSQKPMSNTYQFYIWKTLKMIE